MIELEMEKLGIAALGMFNRGKLFLHVSELKKDLLHMNAEMPVYENVGRMLEEAEVLFGSFFFIHHSKTGNENPVGKRRDETIKEEAFEFLHKTFYEFLVADVILKYLIREIDSLDDLGHSRKKENYEKALNDPNHLSKQYYTALMYMSLCKDVAIIHMLTEWKESLIALYFPGERSDFDTVFEALFVKQIDLFHERILIPDIWVRNVNDDKKKMSYLQHCATYLFNLLILKTIINCEQESRMELESWKKMAQFWKMNIPEEVILKFSAIFKVYRDEENVCVKKDFFIREVKQEKLREVRLNMANFLQDEFAYDLCILHNNEMENHSKQHCREELFKSGFDIEFEVVLGEIENLLLKGCEYVGLLMDNIKRGTTILYERKIIDSAMVFNWLMNINKLIEKTKFQSRNYKVVEGLSEIIFKEYGEDLSIVLEFFKVAKNITEDSRVQRQFESNYLVHWLYEQPKLFLNYVHSAKDYVLNREMAYSFFGNFKNIFYKDAESAIELFEMFYGFGVDMEMNSMLTWIWNWRDEICIKEPKAITKLLKFWIMINRKENVKEFLEENDVKIIEILNMNPEISADMLEIVQKVQIENNYADIVIENILCNFEKIFVKFPKVIIRLLNVINASNDYSFNRDMIRLILKNYGRVFHLAPQEAVLLLRIVQNTGRNDMCYPAVKYALAHFGEVLGTSVDTAIKLIYLCKKMPVKNSVDGLASYVRQCFEYIIFNDVVFDIGMMIGLLKKLDPKETAELRNYFGKRFIYIEEKYPTLAKK